jgi:ADP-heptose:LPS heptosyltransferase
VKTCCIVRYGAIGDMIMVSSILPGLKEQGYHVTVNCYPSSKEIIKNDPNVDAFLLQEPDEVLNAELKPYWDKLAAKFDKFINLSESVEGTLLGLPFRMTGIWPKEARAFLMDRNYLEFHHVIAGVPLPPRAKFYPTAEESAWAQKEKDRLKGKYVILWSLSGSATHKISPWTDDVMRRLFANTDDVHVILAGGPECEILEMGWEEDPRVSCVSGQWSIRQSLTFAQVADLVIGTETGLLNAVGLEPVPKVILLSHSSPEMLTKHWKNTKVLEPDTKCYPCRLLHYDRSMCPKAPTGASFCAESITPDMMYRAIIEQHDAFRMKELGYEHTYRAGHHRLGASPVECPAGG